MSKAEKTKQMIIEKATALFNVKGIAGTSVEDIIRSAKIARGCLYGHFESKEDLAQTCAAYALDMLDQKRAELMDKRAGAREKIFAFLDMNKDPLKPFIDGGCPMMNLSTEVDDTDPVIRKMVRSDIQRHLKLFTDILQQGVDEGEFSDALVPGDFSVKMFSAVKGALVISSIQNSAQPVRTVIRQLKEELSSFVPDTVNI